MPRAHLKALLSPRRAAAVLLAVLLAGGATAQAGSTAVYEVRFQALWSAASHPGAFPNGGHFSPLIGATHRASFRLWQDGGLATNGVEVMAESGNPFCLRNEVREAIMAGDAEMVIQGAGIDSPGSTTTTFVATVPFSHVSLLTMIAPSPDWFLGSESVDLHAGGTWQDGVEVSLYAWDAGTDSGVDFLSPDQNTVPHEPIGLITSGPLGGALPLGTYTFHLLSVSSVPALPVWGLAVMTIVLGIVGAHALRRRAPAGLREYP